MGYGSTKYIVLEHIRFSRPKYIVLEHIRFSRPNSIFLRSAFTKIETSTTFFYFIFYMLTTKPEACMARSSAILTQF